MAAMPELPAGEDEIIPGDIGHWWLAGGRVVRSPRVIGLSLK